MLTIKWASIARFKVGGTLPKTRGKKSVCKGNSIREINQRVSQSVVKAQQISIIQLRQIYNWWRRGLARWIYTLSRGAVDPIPTRYGVTVLSCRENLVGKLLTLEQDHSAHQWSYFYSLLVSIIEVEDKFATILCTPTRIEVDNHREYSASLIAKGIVMALVEIPGTIMC